MQKEDWNGYEKMVFEVNGRESLVVRPKTPAAGNPWVWRAEYFGAFDQVDRALLDKGWHIGYHAVRNLYGAPVAIDSMKDYHDYVCKEFRLSRRASVFGFSVGGLYSFNYAHKYPDDVRSLYLDAPALSLTIFRRRDFWPALCEAYAKTYPDAELGRQRVRQKLKLSPIDNATAFVKTKIPIIMVVGLLDEAAVYAKNGEIFNARFEKAGGELKLITKPDCGHHPHSLEDPAPIVDWILAH
ncbi:MAG: lysophospholipase [Clostridiales bacterium]|jgi:pimeloyl-ACP methyl ester carboxylesterase|nr:lysophospholipase [Clostridiales bacterium]